MLYIQSSILEVEEIDDQCIRRAEKHAGVKFDKEFEAFLQATNGAFCPKASYILPGQSEPLVETDTEPKISELIFYSVLGRYRTHFDWFVPSGLEFPHFEKRLWLIAGITSYDVFLLRSVKDRSLASIYKEDETELPTPIEATVTDLHRQVYRNLHETRNLKFTTELQCHYFFAQQMSKRLRDFFHFECERSEPSTYVENAILLELPKPQLVAVFEEHAKEINQRSKEGALPIDVAAVYGRSEAVGPLIKNGADLTLSRGETGAFCRALRVQDVRFAREMVKHGYEPNDHDLRVLERGIREADAEYILRGTSNR